MTLASTDWRGGLAVVALLAGCAQEYQVAAPIDVDPADVLECAFSPISGTQLSVYDCNPVFAGTDENWGQGFRSVGFRTQSILGHPFYQIWYSATPDGDLGDYGLGYAVSGDGTNWETHAGNPVIDTARGWDDDLMDQVRVVWDADSAEYVLAYQGFNLREGTFGIGMFTSPDGVDWRAFNGGQPVLDLTTPVNGVRYCWPVGFNWTQEDGFFGYLGGSSNGEDVCQIYSFGGRDLDQGFQLSREPVLQAGPEAYDAAGMVSAATVLHEGTYYMFYVGFRRWEPGPYARYSQNHTVNLATSTDGVSWTKHPDNPLPVNLTAPGVVGEVAAQVVGSRVHLWINDWYDDLGQSAVGYYIFEPDVPAHP